jgi:hypothetical protein
VYFFPTLTGLIAGCLQETIKHPLEWLQSARLMPEAAALVLPRKLL